MSDATTDEGKAFLFEWREAFVRSNLAPVTRHVLLTLAMHMDTTGGSCYPNVRTLARETGLSRRTVMTHLRLARAGGWLASKRRGQGQGWALTIYQAMVPDYMRAETGQEALEFAERGERPSPRQDMERGESDDRRGESDDINVVNHVHLSTSLSTSKSTPMKSAQDKVRPSLVFNGQVLQITEQQDKTLADAFPWVDRQAEYRCMDSWCVCNGKRIRRCGRFAHNWIAKVPPPLKSPDLFDD
jgi:hypothetical protein